MKRPTRRTGVLFACAVVAVVAGGFLLARGDFHRPAVAATVVPGKTAVPDRIALAADAPVLSMIRIQPVTEVPLPLTEVLSARLVYDEDRTARVTTGFAGRIVKLIAQPGDIVRPGSPLAEIDSPDFGLAASDLVKAQADEVRKRLTLNRSRDLLQGGVIPQKDLESADADFAQARAETTRAAQRVRNINPGGQTLPNGHFLLTSPMAGVVTERNANPAMEVSPALALPLFVISDLGRLWVLIDLPERLIGQVTQGMHVAVESEAYPGRTFDATIDHIAQILDPATRRIAVRAVVDNADLRLRPEMFVRATVLGDRGAGVRLPNEAFVTEGLYTYVYVQSADNAYRRVRVEPSIKGPEFSYVSGSIRSGERVVTSGALLLDAEQHETADAGPGAGSGAGSGATPGAR